MPRRGLHVLDQRLVGEVEHGQRQHGSPVRHGPAILSLIGADVSQVVGERDAVSVEKLRKTREARVHRVAGAVDDAGFGEQQFDETEELEVLPHLVGDADRLGRDRIEPLPVGIGEAIDVRLPQGGHGLRVLVASRAGSQSQQANVGQFPRAVGERVTRDDLLDE